MSFGNINVDDCEIIYTEGLSGITIGSSYNADIFYNYRNHIEPLHGILHINGREVSFENKKTGEIKKIEYGDTFNIEGMFMCYLGKILIVFAKFGSFRIARRGKNVSY